MAKILNKSPLFYQAFQSNATTHILFQSFHNFLQSYRDPMLLSIGKQFIDILDRCPLSHRPHMKNNKVIYINRFLKLLLSLIHMAIAMQNTAAGFFIWLQNLL